MKKYRIGLIFAAVIIIIAELFILDYDNLFSSENLGNSLTMIAMIVIIISLVLFFKNDVKEAEKIEK